MDIIISKKLGQDIAEIIMINLWKNRFNIVIKEVQGVCHYSYEAVCFNMHCIKIRDYTELRYNEIYSKAPHCESWLIFSPSGNFYQILRKHNIEIWKK